MVGEVVYLGACCFEWGMITSWERHSGEEAPPVVPKGTAQVRLPSAMRILLLRKLAPIPLPGSAGAARPGGIDSSMNRFGEQGPASLFPDL